MKKKIKKNLTLLKKSDAQTPIVSRILDHRSSPIGLENWEVCSRMLIHDLLELDNPDVKRILKFYSIDYTPWGTYTMALPRWYVVNPKKKK